MRQGCLPTTREQGIVVASFTSHLSERNARARPAGRQPSSQMAAEPADEDVERHVRKRFEVCQRLGKGAYGVVWKAIERRSRSTGPVVGCVPAILH